MISFISGFEIVNVVIPDPKTFIWVAASVADADATVNSNGTKILLPNEISTFLVKSKPDFYNCLKSLPKHSPDSPILWNWVFDHFVLAEYITTFVTDIVYYKI